MTNRDRTSVMAVLAWLIQRVAWRRVGACGAVLGALLLIVVPAVAHTEGILQLAAVPAGVYSMSVWTSPEPATTGEELHVAIALVLAEDASPVFGADILVQLTRQSDGAVISGPATIENSENKFLHEAILEVDKSGDYLVEIFVNDAAGGGEVSFPLLVEGKSGLNWTLILVAVAVVASAVILIARYRRES